MSADDEVRRHLADPDYRAALLRHLTTALEVPPEPASDASARGADLVRQLRTRPAAKRPATGRTPAKEKKGTEP